MAQRYDRQGSKMDLKLELQGSDATEETTIAVQDWIRREKIEGLRVGR